ncbi:hypothetical protein Vadar_020570 [Vaccinium darrowii]|uniref:Uncharacterized protein n=1 Tax=Vaccinium darrowii TaxID=229202 RepID=A0ACB7XRU3_9ERIC|nr:hypothetical protein Vadar_020570 [Vaccinium darrowii]
MLLWMCQHWIPPPHSEALGLRIPLCWGRDSNRNDDFEVASNITNFVGNVKILPQFLNFKAEIGIFEKDAGMDNTRATDSEFVVGGPTIGRGGGGWGEEIGDNEEDGVGALVSK